MTQEHLGYTTRTKIYLNVKKIWISKLLPNLKIHLLFISVNIKFFIEIVFRKQKHPMIIAPIKKIKKIIIYFICN